MPTAEKAHTIAELTEKLSGSKGTVLLDYRGLNVAQLRALRTELSQSDVEFHVAKNTLLRIAADGAQVEVAPELLTGPTAVAFGWADEVSPARLLVEFARRNRNVSVKGGVIGGRSYTAQQIEQVAELPTREVLLSQLLGAIQAPMAKALGTIQAPAREVAGLAQALRDKQEGNQAA